MPIRSIKPEFWTDETIVELSMAARLLFIGTWNFTDHKGRMEFSVKRIKMLVFPGELNIDIPPLLAELQRENLISIYDVDNKRYLQVNNFEKHQKIDSRYANSKIPPPDSAGARCIPLVEWSGVEWSGVENNTVRQAEPSVKIVLQENIKIPKNTPGDIEPEKRVVQPAAKSPDTTGVPDTTKKPETDSKAPRAIRSDAIVVLEFLNEKTNRNYRPVPANLDMIKARLKEYTSDELKQVVANRVREWGSDDKMEKFLRPKTLFNRTNCANYIGELVAPKETRT